MLTQAAINFSALPQGDYPLAHTEACRILAKALERANDEKGWSQRQLARMLNYKTSVVLSHMASGRAPIPIDRVMDFARLLDIDAPSFLIATLEQRHPGIDFRRVLAGLAKGKQSAGSNSSLLAELESISGVPFDELPVAVINVLREVVADRNGARRFLKMGEVPLIEHLRKTKPDGLTPVEMKKIQDFISSI